MCTFMYVSMLISQVNELSAKLSAAEEELRLQKGEHELLSIAQIQVQKKLQDCEKRYLSAAARHF